MTNLSAARRAVNVTLIWLAVGVVSGTQLYLAAAARGAEASFWGLTTLQIRNALPWIPITAIVFLSVRTMPISKREWRLRAALYGLGGVALVCLLNIVQAALHILTLGEVPDPGFWATVVSGTVEWGHIAFGVYVVLVAVAHGY